MWSVLFAGLTLQLRRCSGDNMETKQRSSLWSRSRGSRGGRATVPGRAEPPPAAAPPQHASPRHSSPRRARPSPLTRPAQPPGVAVPAAASCFVALLTSQPRGLSRARAAESPAAGAAPAGGRGVAPVLLAVSRAWPCSVPASCVSSLPVARTEAHMAPSGTRFQPGAQVPIPLSSSDPLAPNRGLSSFW